MEHHFDIDVAVKYGVNAAIILNNFAFWLKKNEANGVNFYDGNYWTYNSRRAFAEIFPYLSEKQISTALDKLIDDGIVVTGNYNNSAYDRTLWYALTEKGKSILHFGKMESPKTSNGKPENVKPIPYNNTDKNPNIKPNKAAIRFTAPTIDEVKAYCIERKNYVDAERFVDYYTSNGWLVGKNKMKDWKAAVRTWERNGNTSTAKPNLPKTSAEKGLDAILPD